MLCSAAELMGILCFANSIRTSSNRFGNMAKVWGNVNRD